jgi:hypothetical protein
VAAYRFRAHLTGRSEAALQRVEVVLIRVGHHECMKAYSEDLRIDKDGGETLRGPQVVLARSSVGTIRPVGMESG